MTLHPFTDRKNTTLRQFANKAERMLCRHGFVPDIEIILNCLNDHELIDRSGYLEMVLWRSIFLSVGNRFDNTTLYMTPIFGKDNPSLEILNCMNSPSSEEIFSFYRLGGFGRNLKSSEKGEFKVTEMSLVFGGAYSADLVIECRGDVSSVITIAIPEMTGHRMVEHLA